MKQPVFFLVLILGGNLKEVTVLVAQEVLPSSVDRVFLMVLLVRAL
jgi:hypothetical protein